MTTTRPRGPRGRVLLVGDDPISDELAQRWPNAVCCPNPFDALARIIGAVAREPVVAVAVHAAGASNRSHSAARFGESVAALDPSIELIPWRSETDDPTPSNPTTATTVPNAAGLHAEVIKRLGWGAETLPSEEATPPNADAEATSPPPPPRSVPTPRETMPPSLETARTAPVPSDRPTRPPIPTVETMPPSKGPLGDLDLVRAVLSGGKRLAETALALLRERLDTEDLDLLPPTPPPTVRGRSAVEVRDRDERLGWLASGSIPATVLAPWAAWLATWMRLDAAHAEWRRQALTDELTGVGNRRAFEQVLSQTLAEARPRRRPVTLMVFDIDNFKTYNDQHGHEAGDEVLRETVQLLQSTIRRGDHVFRIGGDEFVVIFSDPDGPRSPGTTPIESIEEVVRRFQAQVPRLRLPTLGLDAPGTVTVSAGLATYPWDGLEADTLLAHADRLALKSKREGKNRITFGPGAREHFEQR